MQSNKKYCQLMAGNGVDTHFVSSPFLSNLPVEKFPIASPERPYRYSKNTLLAYVENESIWFNHLGKDFEKILLMDSLRAWSRHCNLKFRLTQIKGDADITLEFRTLRQDFYLKPNILAYAWFPEEKDNPPTDIIINDDFGRWSLDGKSIPAYVVDPAHYDVNSKTTFKTYRLPQVLRHESGHKLGLLHDDTHKDSMMYPYYNGQIGLNYYDISRIQAYYGKKSISQRLLEYFKARDINNEWIEELSK